MKKIPVWIDCDTGVDDSIALLTALKLEQLDILGVSAVAGNVKLENTFPNTRNVLHLANRDDIKVYAGANKPLVIELEEATWIHGKNGLGNVEIEESPAEKETKKAWDALYETAKNYGEKITVIAVGPLTNIAITIAKHPDVVDYIEVLNIMGGALDGGNASPCAEFNIYADPQAAENVFKSGIHVNMFGLDVTQKAFINEEEYEAIKKMENKQGKFVASELKHYEVALTEKFGAFVPHLHDSCPVVFTAYPELFKGHDCGIYVETQGTITFGKTCSDLWTDFKYEDRHCTAFLEVDREKLIKITLDALRSY